MSRLAETAKVRLMRAVFFGECLAVVAAVRTGLCLAPARTVRRIVGQVPAGREAKAEDLRLIARGVGAAARLVPGASCLTQALAGRTLLMRRGIASTIRIGIDRSSSTTLKAHAWLVCGDRIVLGGSSHTLRAFSHLVTMER